jgi:hypothetical protein
MGIRGRTDIAARSGHYQWCRFPSPDCLSPSRARGNPVLDWKMGQSAARSLPELGRFIRETDQVCRQPKLGSGGDLKWLGESHDSCASEL